MDDCSRVPSYLMIDFCGAWRIRVSLWRMLGLLLCVLLHCRWKLWWWCRCHSRAALFCRWCCWHCYFTHIIIVIIGFFYLFWTVGVHYVVHWASCMNYISHQFVSFASNEIPPFMHTCTYTKVNSCLFFFPRCYLPFFECCSFCHLHWWTHKWNAVEWNDAQRELWWMQPVFVQCNNECFKTIDEAAHLQRHIQHNAVWSVCC